MYSRREFGKLAISGVTAAATMPVSKLWAQAPSTIDSTVRGVKLGIISNGLRGGAPGGRPGGPGAPGAAPPPPPPPLDFDQFIEDLRTLGVGNLESALSGLPQPVKVSSSARRSAGTSP